MKKAKVVYVSASGKSCLLNVETKIGKLVATQSGFLKIAEGETVEIGEEMELPATAKVEKRQLVDEVTGEVREFNWFTL